VWHITHTHAHITTSHHISVWHITHTTLYHNTSQNISVQHITHTCTYHYIITSQRITSHLGVTYNTHVHITIWRHITSHLGVTYNTHVHITIWRHITSHLGVTYNTHMHTSVYHITSHLDSVLHIKHTCTHHYITSDVNELFAFYDKKLRSTLDEHTPLKVSNIRAVSSSARWYNAKCRLEKIKRRHLERIHRQMKTDELLSAWRQQFAHQRIVFKSRFQSYWTETITENRHDNRA